MLNKIKELEKLALPLEPTIEVRNEWDVAVLNYSSEFLDNIENLKAYVLDEDKGKKIYDFPFSDEGRNINELIDIVSENVDTPGLNPASGGHLGYIPGGGVYPTALGDYMADVFNRYAGVFFGSPGAVRMENMLIRWMNDVIGFPKHAMGNLTSGGSIANLIAIVTARDAQNIKAKDIENSCIYLTEHVHHSLQKAIRIAGLNEANLRYIPMDDKFRMDVEILEKQIQIDRKQGLKPFLVISSAGTTDVGAIDPLDAIADVCEQNELWMHVDGAYGGFFILVDEEKHKFKGIERADSVTIDPHKGLFLSYGTGAVLIKNVEALQNTHYYQANYMQDAESSVDELSPADLSPELTKHFRGMRMWLPLQLFGLKPYVACVEEKLWLCRYFYEEIQKLGFEVGPEPDLSVCIYRFVPEKGSADEFNKKLVEAVKADGRVFLSSTKINDDYWLRIAVLSFRSHLRTINLALNVLKENRDLLLNN